MVWIFKNDNKRSPTDPDWTVYLSADKPKPSGGAAPSENPPTRPSNRPAREPGDDDDAHFRGKGDDFLQDGHSGKDDIPF
jgi:hypothetical protein